MRPPSQADIEAELSYAYLHAVASHAGAACRSAVRLEDNNGIDATLTAWAPFENGGYLQEVDLKVQLKATVHTPTENETHLSYFLAESNKALPRYNDLRQVTVSVPRILVVLFLPGNYPEWLSHSTDALILKRCAYWVSLRGAPNADNETGVTIKLPKIQAFSPENLRALFSKLSRKEIPLYEAL